MGRLQDKIVIVTGSSTGIGEAIARRIVREGGRVLVHGLEENDVQRVAADLGPAAAGHVDDLEDPNSAERTVAAALNAFGRIDGLVNNAAWVVASSIRDTDPEHFDQVLRINTRAPLLLIRAALDHLAQTRGCVVNIGSVNAYSGEDIFLPYSISKGALMTMTRNLGDCLHRQYGVRVNQVNPGWVLTENEKARKVLHGMAEDWYEHLSPAFAPSGRILRPEEIAAAVLYFLDEESGPISGIVFECEQFPFVGRNPPKS
ncbi:MAG TPA: SDR family oxidoreductase [Verrucomicrobiales bacterium]|nr:SDR family oxidoreductase [Verrucomicrobiales bacterium]